MAAKRTVLITGCSDHGLGAALALAFHKAGWRLKEVVTAGVETLQVDVTSDESIANSVSAVKNLSGGSLDALVNNAGATYNMPFMDIDIEKTRALFNVNTFSIITMTRVFLPLLMKSTNGGMVINNTSISSLSVFPFAAVYGTSKAAATGFTEALRLELSPFGIKVINLMTGSVRSDIWDNGLTPILPPTSLYNIAKETIEKAIGGGDMADGANLTTPPHWILQGRFASQMRMICRFPIGFWGGTVKSLSEVAVLEQKIKEQRGIEKVVAHNGLEANLSG
ncbi:putative estradiol 17 beta-dehydrogenase [Hypoxylon sp. FL1150]|nr:putative estradiol 17 beta-dehydrogenase [Hypoxylon sp. FL1150]